MSKRKPTSEHTAQKQIVIILNNDSEEEWVRGYNEYCNKTGKQLSISPVYQLRDDGTFSTVVKTGVIKNNHGATP